MQKNEEGKVRLFMFVFFSFVMILLFAACGESEGYNSDLDSGPTDTDTDTDSDSDTDTDADGGVIDCAGGRLDVAHNLCWQHPKASEIYEWQRAIDYCDALDLGEHTDWVLPTRQDFVDMLGNCDAFVLSGGGGYCDLCAESDTCGELFGSDIDWYWSSSPYDDDYAWYARFYDGAILWGFLGVDDSVRCVRPGP